jgi:dienelactone hydrolase
VYKFYSSAPAWVALLQQQGYATLRLDNFTARGHAAGICGDVKAVSSAERAQDAFAAAYLLAGRPDVRPDRIALIGWSHGAGGAIYAARDHEDLGPWREKLAARGGELAASVVLVWWLRETGGLPRCCTVARSGGSQGRLDGGAASCVALANAQVKPIVTVQLYPNAYHGFDTPGDSHYFLGHMIAYDAAATADARTRIVEFLNRFLH